MDKMKRLGLVILIVSIGAGVLWLKSRGGNLMQLTSVFENNQLIPSKFTCDGENVNPELNITGVPKEAKGLSLIVDDPDAPSGDFVHWVMWNIGAETTQIKENTNPAGAVVGKNDFGNNGYGGPCPPEGIHRYQFKVYALDVKLDLPASAGKQELLAAMNGHILDQTVLVGNYGRR
jgi:Raf kinase inhibitor-like YbhB/YbcL family protein